MRSRWGWDGVRWWGEGNGEGGGMGQYVKGKGKNLKKKEKKTHAGKLTDLAVLKSLAVPSLLTEQTSENDDGLHFASCMLQDSRVELEMIEEGKDG